MRRLQDTNRKSDHIGVRYECPRDLYFVKSESGARLMKPLIHWDKKQMGSHGLRVRLVSASTIMLSIYLAHLLLLVAVCLATTEFWQIIQHAIGSRGVCT